MPEPLPEYCHQLSVHYIAEAIEHLEHAATADQRDKPTHLKRADAAIAAARNSARTVMSFWRTYNERARDIHALIWEGDLPSEKPQLEQEALPL